MVTLGIGLFLLGLGCLLVVLINPRFRTWQGILAATVVLLIAAGVGYVGLRSNQVKTETALKAKEAEVSKEKSKAEQASREKIAAERKAKAQQASREKADAEQKAATEQVSREASTEPKIESQGVATNTSETEQGIKEETNQANLIAAAQNQIIGKTYSVVPSLYDGEDVNQAMAENKAPQNLFHDGAQIITFTNDTTAHIQLNGAYRPDYDAGYTLSETTLSIGQHAIPYTYANDTMTFNPWTTTLDGHTVTWTITPNN